MAHSIQIFRNKFQAFNDEDLLVIIIIGIRLRTRFRRLDDLFNDWELCLDEYGTGCIDLNLSLLQEEDVRLKEFAVCMKLISEFLDSVCSEELIKILNAKSPHGVVFKALNNPNIQRAVSRLEKLTTANCTQ